MKEGVNIGEGGEFGRQTGCGCRSRPLHRPLLREILSAFAPDPAPVSTIDWCNELYGRDGSGVKIALLDSGINWSEKIFSGARIVGRDFTSSGSLFDPTNHGTANAALLVGQGIDKPIGICPGSELMVAKVLGHRNWERTVRAITKALNWVIHSGAEIIVLPFGTSRRSMSIVRMIRAAVARECSVLAAAGNRGRDNIFFPACLPEVTAVSALTRDGHAYSNCCTRDVDLYTLGDRVPVHGLGPVLELSGSSPATVLAGGFTALKRTALQPA